MKYTLEHAESPAVPGGVVYFLKEVTEGYDLIQVRRGLRADLPITLEPGEFAFCTDTNELYIGSVNGTPVSPKVSIPVDNQLSDSSENPVQNKVITAAITAIQQTIGDIHSAIEEVL